jgi:protein SCO1/2
LGLALGVAVCRDMKLHVFPNPQTERGFGNRFRTVRIDLATTAALIDTDGKTSFPKQLAQRLGITGTPAPFFDHRGGLNYRHSGLISKPLDFALRDQYGRLRHLADFRGKAVALAVGYTQCPDVSPTTMSEMLQIVTYLGADAKQVQVRFATLDPERDKPDILGAYMAAFYPDFLALRGNAAQTAAFIKRFDLVAIKRPLTGHAGYTLDHTAGIFCLTAVANYAASRPMVNRANCWQPMLKRWRLNT